MPNGSSFWHPDSLDSPTAYAASCQIMVGFGYGFDFEMKSFGQEWAQRQGLPIHTHK